jgi:hypothetical protein
MGNSQSVLADKFHFIIVAKVSNLIEMEKRKGRIILNAKKTVLTRCIGCMKN